MAETGIGAAAGAGLKWGWQHREKVEPILKAFYREVKKRLLGRSPGILILGAGGTGKTTLGKILSGKYDFLFDAGGHYEQSIAVQTFRDKQNPDVEVVVAPGQEDRREATWPALEQRLSRGKEMGVILCGAYGYHSLTTSYKYHRAYNRETPESFLGDFLEDRRKEEIRILKRLAASIGQNVRPTWLLSFVGKEDLWSRDEKKAYDFYKAGEYAKQIRQLAQKKGDLFRHEIVMASSVIQNFATGRGEHLHSNTEGYDHTKQVRSLRNLFEVVAGLQQWKMK